jgi:plastocyanin
MIFRWNGSTWSPSVLSVGSENWLRSASAVSANDIWAVGSARSGAGWQPLAEHYDGTAWSVVPTDTSTDPYVVLTGVSAVSTSNVWAVGQVFDGSLYHPLAEHYDGTAWSIVPTPDLGGPEGYLQAVAAVSANDIWATGETYDGSHFHPLLEHWNGSAWSVDATLASIPGDAQLAGITALSTNDVWAVGSKGSPTAGTLAVHWDGSSWSQETAPDVGDTSVLTSVSGTGGGNVWAVGYSSTGGDTSTLAERWNGSAWSVVPSPNTTDENILSILLSVDARNPDDVWASGFYNTGAVTKTLVLHYDGTAWALDPTPNVNEDDSNELDAIVSPAAGQVWAVGNQEQLGFQETLCPVTVTNTGFSPTPVVVQQGALVTWAVPESAGQNHTVSDASKMGLLGSGTLAPGATYSFQFFWAGVFKQKDATTGKKGTVKTTLVASPTSGTTTDLYTLTYATQAPPAGYVEDIQLKRPGSGGYVDWQTGLTGTSITFSPDAGPGNYLFQASLRKLSNGAHSGWAKVTIATH